MSEIKGYRSQLPVDVDAIEKVLLRVSRLVEEIHEISELDLNPTFALPEGQGCKIVDAKIRLGLPNKSDQRFKKAFIAANSGVSQVILRYSSHHLDKQATLAGVLWK